jgi:hypothetical protein
MLSQKEVPSGVVKAAFDGRITNRQVAEASASRFATKWRSPSCTVPSDSRRRAES